MTLNHETFHRWIQLVSVSTVLALFGFITNIATAQDSRQPELLAEPDEADPADDDGDGWPDFGWISLSPQVGYAYFPKAELKFQDYTLNVDQRNALVIKLHLDLGGAGPAVEAAPFVAIERGGGGFAKIAQPDFNGGLKGGMGGDFIAVGGQLNTVYRFNIGPVYPHLGLGFHGAFLIADEIDYGAEFYGRLPFGMTWYVLDYLGLVIEGGVSFGVTGIKGKIPATMAELAKDIDISSLDQSEIENLSQDELEAAARAELAKKIQFGFGMAFDISFGIRFP